MLDSPDPNELGQSLEAIHLPAFAVDHATSGLFVIERANSPFTSITGLDPDRAGEIPVEQACGLSDTRALAAVLTESLSTGRAVRHRGRWSLGTGEREFWTSFLPVRVQDSTRTRLIGHSTPVNEDGRTRQHPVMIEELTYHAIRACSPMYKAVTALQSMLLEPTMSPAVHRALKRVEQLGIEAIEEHRQLRYALQQALVEDRIGRFAITPDGLEAKIAELEIAELRNGRLAAQ